MYVSHYLGDLQDDAKSAERVVKKLLVDFRVQITDEKIGADVEVLLMRRRLEKRDKQPHQVVVPIQTKSTRVFFRYLVDADRLAVEFDHVHDLDGVLGVLLVHELDEAVALMVLRDAVFGHMNVDDGACLDEELPQNGLGDLLVETSHVNCGI